MENYEEFFNATKNIKTIIELTLSLLAESNFYEAEKFIRKAIFRFPQEADNAELLSQLGLIYFAQGNKEQAKQFFSKAQKNATEDTCPSYLSLQEKLNNNRQQSIVEADYPKFYHEISKNLTLFNSNLKKINSTDIMFNKYLADTGCYQSKNAELDLYFRLPEISDVQNPQIGVIVFNPQAAYYRYYNQYFSKKINFPDLITWQNKIIRSGYRVTGSFPLNLPLPTNFESSDELEQKMYTSFLEHCLTNDAKKGIASSQLLIYQKEQINSELILRKTDFREILNLHRTQWLATENLREIQNYFLRKIVKEAYENVPYYTEIMQKAGVDPYAVKDISDLKNMPIIDKQTFYGNYSRMKHRNFDSLKTNFTGTGGSSGMALKYYVSPEVYTYGIGCRNRGFSWTGCNWDKDKIAFLAGGSLGVVGKMELKGNKLKLPATGIDSQDVMKTYYEALLDFKADYLRAYPQSIYEFCQFLKKHNKPLHFKAVVTTGSTLFPVHREFIEDYLHCKIFNEYGAYDGGAGAFECEEHQGLHLQMERGIIEIIKDNGQPAEAGEEGKIVVTDLHNYVMPFIRYEVGDRAVLAKNSCSCGRGLLLLESISGRANDIILLKDGTRKSTLEILHLFNKMIQGNLINIKQFQVHQLHDYSLVASLIPDADFTDRQGNTVAQVMQEHLNLPVEIRVVEAIVPPPSGKHRFVFSDIIMGKKPKICHIGGTHSIHLQGITEELQKRGYEQCLIGYFPLEKNITPAAIPSYSFPYKTYNLPEWQKNNAEAKLEDFLREILAKEKPDILHGHSLTYSAKALTIAQKISGLPAVIFPWSAQSIKVPDSLYNRAEQAALDCCSYVLHALPGMFKLMQSFYRNLPAEKHKRFLGVILDLAPYQIKRSLNAPPALLSARMMGEAYRQDLLIEALPQVLEKYPQLEVTFHFGHSEQQANSYAKKMMTRAKELRISDNCHFLQRSLSDEEFIEMIVNHNIIYSLAAYDTGFSGTTIKAALTGAITIVQDTPEIDGILDHDIHVLRTPLTVAGVEKTLFYALDNYQKLITRFSENNRFLANYDTQKQMPALEEIYWSLKK